MQTECRPSHERYVFVGGLNASYDLSPQYAAVSGFPSSRLIGTANSSGTDQPSCGAPASGYMTSLTAQYYADPYETEQTSLPLSFDGAANLTRCAGGCSCKEAP